MMTVEEAITALAGKPTYQTAERALRTLIENDYDVDDTARPALVATYERFERKGKDGTGEIRAKVLEALRPIVSRADIPLLEQALQTYSIVPAAYNPDHVVGLRASALNTLNLIDDQLAAWYAIRQLTDPYASKTSGEPALTAVRILAGQGNTLPLYQFALSVELDGFHTRVAAEVLAECVSHLYALPTPLLQHLLTKYYPMKDDIVMLGVIDLMTKVRPSAPILPTLTHFIRETDNLDLFRYCVHIIAGSRNVELARLILPELEQVAPPKSTIVAEVSNELQQVASQ